MLRRSLRGQLSDGSLSACSVHDDRALAEAAEAQPAATLGGLGAWGARGGPSSTTTASTIDRGRGCRRAHSVVAETTAAVIARGGRADPAALGGARLSVGCARGDALLGARIAALAAARRVVGALGRQAVTGRRRQDASRRIPEHDLVLVAEVIGGGGEAAAALRA